MNNRVLNCNKIADNILSNIKEKTKDKKFSLAVISFNDSIYKKLLEEKCNLVGITFKDYRIDNLTTLKVLEVIDSLNNDNTITGILIEEPVTNNIDKYKCYNAINTNKDIDGVNPINQYYLSINKPKIVNSVIVAIDKIFKFYNISLESKDITIIGRSYNISKPLFNYLINKDATVTICHSKTKNLNQILSNSDIIISITGKNKLVKSSILKDNSIFIDVGLGDLLIDSNNIYYTPKINGVGQVAILSLLENLVNCNLK